MKRIPEPAARPSFAAAVLAAALLALLPGGAAGRQKSPYAGEQMRDIKALSTEQTEEYRTGKGMGLARAAELNRLPGPRHVLDLAAELELSAEQQSRTQAIYDAMHDRAVALGEQILEKERELDRLFARIGQHRSATHSESSGATEMDHAGMLEGVRSLTEEIGTMNGRLRYVHLGAHLELKNVLSSEQIQRYVELRGYTDPGTARDPARHGHGE